MQAVEYVQRLGEKQAAADELGIPRATLQHRLRVAAARGLAPASGLNHPVAPGFTLRGYSHLSKTPSGEPIWIKADRDKEQALESLRAAVEALKGELVPCAPTVAPDTSLDALCTLYTFTDYHVGALCWHREGGDDWDTDIAEQMGARAMRALVDSSPASKAGIVNIQGDFLHFDGLESLTPTSGHVLDADSRFGKVVEVAIRLIRRLVDTALEKHEQVTLLICEGNHDIASSVWLRKLFGALYEMEPRVSVHDSELPYYAIQWGRTMLGFHHGHLKKNIQLPELFAAQFREMWGKCDKVAIHTGHFHHRELREHAGCEVIRHPTLAARDAYAARHGWQSQRRITAITYHKEFGEVGTSTVCPEMLT